ncbi:MAG: sulfite exporter TauE/SafE family protein [Ignavibacteria bacterium]
MSGATLVTLFLVGLLGGTHCAGMCGGIVGALSMQAPAGRGAVRIHLAYNLGRIGGYIVAGAIAGTVGYAFGSVLPIERGLYLLANLMLLAMGLYLLGATRPLAALERGGQRLWQRIQPATRRFLPVRGPAQALPLGFLWGWLPCGLVYSALTTALASGSAARGALAMLAFGLGTLPNLLLAGLLLTRYRSFAQSPVARRISGLLVLGFGVYGLFNFWHGL